MGEPIKMRIREGCRGGSEQFTWNQIKDQDFKDREQYLGASTKVGTMGKFGRYYVHDWFAKTREGTESIDQEMKSVKAYEEELMQEALGLKPKKLLLAKKQLTDEEMKELLQKDSMKSADKQGREQMGPQKKVIVNAMGEELATSNEDFIAEAARDAPIKGLGFAVHRTAKLEEIKAATLGTEGQLQGSKGAFSASSLVKVESKTKLEVKEEVGAGGSGTASSSRARPVEPGNDAALEAKRESSEPREKRRHHDREEERGGGKSELKAVKKEKKEAKKRRKAEKKLKKREKKEKKALKRERKAALKVEQHQPTAKRRKGSSSSSSSDSSSS